MQQHIYYIKFALCQRRGILFIIVSTKRLIILAVMMVMTILANAMRDF